MSSEAMRRTVMSCALVAASASACLLDSEGRRAGRLAAIEDAGVACTESRRLDGEPCAYPEAPLGSRRWVVRLPPLPDEAARRKVRLQVGRILERDCCNHVLIFGTAELKRRDQPGVGEYYVLEGNGDFGQTAMACRCSRVTWREFTYFDAPLVPYSGRPIVVYAPSHLTVRYRIEPLPAW